MRKLRRGVRWVTPTTRIKSSAACLSTLLITSHWNAFNKVRDRVLLDLIDYQVRRFC